MSLSTVGCRVGGARASRAYYPLSRELFACTTPAPGRSVTSSRTSRAMSRSTCAVPPCRPPRTSGTSGRGSTSTHAPLVHLPRLRGHVRTERDRHRRQDHREGRRAEPPLVVDRLRQRARVHRRVRRARLPSAHLRAARHGPHPRDDRDDARADRPGPRLRGRRERLLRRPLVRRLSPALQPGVGQPAPARERGRDRQARPARLRDVEGRQARRAELGDAVGRAAVPAGTWSARPWRTSTSAPPSTCTAAASTWSSRTTRTRSPSPRRTATSSRATGRTTPGSP